MVRLRSIGQSSDRTRIGTFLLATFGGSALIHHALEHPMILVGNKAASAISRKRITANVQTAAAIAGVRA
jgi:hypothetical protein